jgi:hypothetical protein
MQGLKKRVLYGVPGTPRNHRKAVLTLFMELQLLALRIKIYLELIEQM